MKLTTALILVIFSLGAVQASAQHGHHKGHDNNHHKSHHKSHHKDRAHRNWHTHAKRAGHHGYQLTARYEHRDFLQHRVNYGRVIEVEPVYRSYSRPVRDTQCLRRESRHVTRTSYTGTVLGAVIGSALGHRIGDAHGDPRAAAVAGGLLGASIGRDIDRNVSENRGLHVAGPCRVRHEQETVRELVEYKVSYRYNGRVYRTHMDHDPGEWVKLDVDVSPV